MRRNLYYYTQLAVGFDEAVALLAGDPTRWLPAPGDATGTAWRVTLDATGAVPAALARRVALVELDPLERLTDRAWRRLRWSDEAAGRGLPVLEADLELEALLSDTSWLALVGGYQPPAGLVGGLADAAAGHRVAEACVRRFVLDVATRLQHCAALARHQASPVGQ